MQHERLRASLDALRDAITSADLEKGPSRERLDRIIRNVEAKLDEPEEEEHHATLLENVKEAIQHLEVEHPKATTILNQIMAALGGVGI